LFVRELSSSHYKVETFTTRLYGSPSDLRLSASLGARSSPEGPRRIADNQIELLNPISHHEGSCAVTRLLDRAGVTHEQRLSD
jgi:hypothetical protein